MKSKTMKYLDQPNRSEKEYRDGGGDKRVSAGREGRTTVIYGGCKGGPVDGDSTKQRCLIGVGPHQVDRGPPTTECSGVTPTTTTTTLMARRRERRREKN